MQFNSEKDRDYFECDSSTVIGQRLALDSVMCNSSVLSFVQTSVSNSSFLAYSLRIFFSKALMLRRERPSSGRLFRKLFARSRWQYL